MGYSLQRISTAVQRLYHMYAHAQHHGSQAVQMKPRRAQSSAMALNLHVQFAISKQ